MILIAVPGIIKYVLLCCSRTSVNIPAEILYEQLQAGTGDPEISPTAYGRYARMSISLRDDFVSISDNMRTHTFSCSLTLTTKVTKARNVRKTCTGLRSDGSSTLPALLARGSRYNTVSSRQRAEGARDLVQWATCKRKEFSGAGITMPDQYEF